MSASEFQPNTSPPARVHCAICFGENIGFGPDGTIRCDASLQGCAAVGRRRKQEPSTSEPRLSLRWVSSCGRQCVNISQTVEAGDALRLAAGELAAARQLCCVGSRADMCTDASLWLCCRCDSNDSVRPPGHSLQVALPNEPINNFEEHGDVRCDSSEDIFAVWLCEPVFMDPIIVDLLECNVQVGAVVAYP